MDSDFRGVEVTLRVGAVREPPLLAGFAGMAWFLGEPEAVLKERISAVH